MARTNPKSIARAKRVKRIRKKVIGTSERPRLRVFKSNKHIYAQIIDDAAGHTLISMSTIDKEFALGDEKGKIGAAKKVGEAIGARAKAAGITKVGFITAGSNLFLKVPGKVVWNFKDF